MEKYTYINLRQRPQLKELAAAWFHSKWNVPQEAYLERINAYLNLETEYSWYLCLHGKKIAGGVGVIENDFHNRTRAECLCVIYRTGIFRQAPAPNPDRKLIRGTICGVRVENIEDPLMQEIRYLDKLVDELAKGKKMEQILRK